MQKRLLILFPIGGILVFACLYAVAANLYPGGSQHDPHAAGFSWRHNYWCNLLTERAINGEMNPGQPFAIAGMIFLAGSLGIFWYLLPGLISTGFVGRRAVQVSGIVAWLPFIFIPWGGHDNMIYISGLLATAALTGTITALYLKRWYLLFIQGIFCILLIIVNNIFYHSPTLIEYLPIVQKFSFFIFLTWICLVAVKLYQLKPYET